MPTPLKSSALQQVWPARDGLAAGSAEHMDLAALRHEIDQLDDRMLHLFERRLALADRVGRAKDAPDGPHLKLRPDRETAVLERVLDKARPESREAVQSLWRQIVGWGLARQGRIEVRVWAPVEPGRIVDASRLRFGDAAALYTARDPRTALEWAAEGRGVAVLAVNADQPWWIGLRREWSMLSVFEGLGGATPTALAVGRIDPAALPGGPRVLVDAGGDAGDGCGSQRRGLATYHGWTLSLTEAGSGADHNPACVGAIGRR